MTEDFSKISFHIFQDDDWYLAKITVPNGNHFYTQGHTEEEVLEMVVDAIMCYYGIKVNWWNRLLHRLRIYPVSKNR